jgi:hypothetical protein
MRNTASLHGVLKKFLPKINEMPGKTRMTGIGEAISNHKMRANKGVFS